MHPTRWTAWLRAHDRNLAALRRAARTAIIMPGLFALGTQVIENATIATFAAFGSFAMLMLVDFGGPVRDRVQALASLVVVGSAFVALGTLVSRTPWLGAVAMAGVGFLVLFAGVVSSSLAGATTSLLLAFILPVASAGPVSSIPDRLMGWGLAGGVAVLAVALLWPAPAVDPLRVQAAGACRAVAGRLRAEVAHVLAGPGAQADAEKQAAARAAGVAVGALRTAFLATPYRPTGLTTAARAVVRLVDELAWLEGILAEHGPPPAPTRVNRRACAVKSAAADVLERGADLLVRATPDAAPLATALDTLHHAITELEQAATENLPVDRAAPDGRVSGAEVLSALEPGFRAQELGFAVSQIGGNIELSAAAERRSWPERVLGREPAGPGGRRRSAQERAGAHVERHSVWLHNSVRAAIGLGLAVYVADRAGVQHSFWVVLGTLSVLRSNALNTGQNILRGILGTTAGFVVGSAVLAIIGTNTTVLWFVLPVAVLVAGVAPAVISFAAGQAAFTLTLVILFNIIQPSGWRVGLLRVEDIAIGCAVSLAVGVLFWPRGAAAALGRALAEAYVDSARYLTSAVEFGMLRCDPAAPGATAAASPTAQAARSAGAARRLDDTFREYLAERGAKPVPLAEITSLVTGVVGLRLAADAVLDLWRRDSGEPAGDRTAARAELSAGTARVTAWYDTLATDLTGGTEVCAALEPDAGADARLLAAVRHDLAGPDGRASGTAVRMIWTADHLDAVRRLQTTLVLPARAATGQAALRPLHVALSAPWRPHRRLVRVEAP